MKQNKMKSLGAILCVHQGYELYGSDRSFALSVAAIKELYPDARIDVVIPKDGPLRQLLAPICSNLIVDEKLAVIRKKQLKKNPFGLMYKIIWGMLSALSQSKDYDLVYINTIVVLDYILAARFMTCSSIVHVREIPVGFQRVVFSKILSFSRAKLIFNSLSTLQTFSLPDNQTKTVVLNGVSGFTNIPIKKRKEESVNILLIGRLTYWKGQLFFLEALSNLLKLKVYKVNVRIVGDVFEDQVEYKNTLLQYVEDNHLQEIVKFESFTDSPEREYGWCDVVVVPSVRPEPFGRVAIEAMSASRCVIAANHGGLVEIVDHGKNGVLFEADSIESLVISLRSVLDSPCLITHYSEHGLITFKQKFSEDVYKVKFKNTVVNA